jgi:RNA polymerase sigma factor (sigma-70 family)
MMGEMPEDPVAQLLDRWRRGDRDDRAWLIALRRPMTRAAWAAIQRVTGGRPRAEDVEEAVFTAFKEFLERDPNRTEKPIGLAVTIATRRGLDVGRKLNRHREFPNTEIVTAEGHDRTALNPEDEVVEAERAEEREKLYRIAFECLKRLSPGQAEVIKATILQDQNLSDWANEQGKSYQAAHKQRTKALTALLGCVTSRLDEHGMGGDQVA